MELAEAGAQGLALAVASGALFGAAAADGNKGLALAALAVIIGADLFGMSLAATPDDHPAWPGYLVGAPVAALAYFTLRDVASVAGQRAGEGGAGGVGFLIVAFAVVLAGLSLIGPLAYVGVVALLAVLYLAFARRKRSSEKHAGLRSLR